MSRIKLTGAMPIAWLTVVSVVLLFIVLRFVAYAWRDSWHEPWIALLYECGCLRRKIVKVDPRSAEGLAKRGLSKELIANKLERERNLAEASP